MGRVCYDKRVKKRKKISTLAVGLLRVHPRGFGFLVPDLRELHPEDIFIPRLVIGGAVDGDRVEVEISPNVSEKGPEGKVLRILKRGRSHVGGTVLRLIPKGGAFAHVATLAKGQEMRLLPAKGIRPKVGDRVIIRVEEWGSAKKESVGVIEQIIGNIEEPSCDVDAAVLEYSLADTFSESVLAEVDAFGDKVSKKELEEREDLRDLECFTIDPDEAKDFDDALSLSKDRKGNYLLGVHIADVSAYVKPGTELDKEALVRCNSTYFPGKVLPMLPHGLSSHLCSLMPHVNRLTATVFMTFDKEGKLKEYRICRSVIKSKKRFTYKEAKEVLDGHKESEHKKTLHLLVELLHKLKKERSYRGSIEFALPDVQVKVDKEGHPKHIEVIEYDITHQLVEECMLKANEVVATHLANLGKPLTYRIHEEPNPENIKEFALLCNALGFKLPTLPTSEDLQKLFDEARESPFGQVLATAFIRSMKLASYSTQNIGHYGLGLTHYTHFTSPIRRYVDLVVHRVLFDEIGEEHDLEKIATACSEKERLSAKAEQSVVMLKKLRLLANQKETSFDGVVTSIKPFGFAFTLPSFLLDGFLNFADLDNDYYVFDEKKRRLKGRHTGKTFTTGDKIKVTIVEIDLITQETKWRLAGKKR